MSLANTARKGNGFEKVVERHHVARGWVVASRRHIAGPGDLLAHHGSYPGESRLIEVKATKSPWSHFGPTDRTELAAYAAKHDLVPLLAWRDEAGGIRLIPKEAWPDGA